MVTARRHCPICGSRANPNDSWFPFCSARCRTQDLAHWATGRYSIPVPASEADEHLEPPRTYEESEADE